MLKRVRAAQGPARPAPDRAAPHPPAPRGVAPTRAAAAAAAGAGACCRRLLRRNRACFAHAHMSCDALSGMKRRASVKVGPKSKPPFFSRLRARQLDNGTRAAAGGGCARTGAARTLAGARRGRRDETVSHAPHGPDGRRFYRVDRPERGRARPPARRPLRHAARARTGVRRAAPRTRRRRARGAAAVALRRGQRGAPRG